MARVGAVHTCIEEDNPYCQPHPVIMLVSAYLVERGLILEPYEVKVPYYNPSHSLKAQPSPYPSQCLSHLQRLDLVKGKRKWYREKAASSRQIWALAALVDSDTPLCRGGSRKIRTKKFG